MAVPIAVPGMEDESSTPVLVEWYFEDGAMVEEGVALCRLDGDGGLLEIASPAGGILRHHYPAGTIGYAGAVIARIVEPGDSEVSPELPRESAAPAVVPFRLRVGEAPGWVVPVTEAGAAIPGLRLWEPDPNPPFADAFPLRTVSNETRFEAIRKEAAASAEVLVMDTGIPVGEASRAVRVLGREWADPEASPIIEDLVLRAFARALEEWSITDGPVALTLVTGESDETIGLAEAGHREFREAVRLRAGGGDCAAENCAWSVTSARVLGIRSGQPRLTAGHALAVFVGGVDQAGTIGVTIAYDSSRIGIGDAARILARARLLMEEPYGLFA